MQDKQVGIVVPIYNVEKYLRQCLDSIVNQTYQNLSIVLVNDGSSDKSLEIALEYARQDARILIIDKENGGLSSARNVGIEFFSREIEIAESHNDAVEKPSQIHNTQSQLHTFTITGENPHQIHTIYSIKSTLEIPHIDYLQFVDSDDWISLDCVEKCVERMRGVDVLWFDYAPFYDNCKEIEHKTAMEHYKCFKEKTITPYDWLKRAKSSSNRVFWFAWQGMIDFTFLKRIQLKFINGIIHEDHHFGILLFAQAKSIYVYPRKCYQYRIRDNSIMNHSALNLEINPPAPYLEKFYHHFERLNEAKHYHRSLSWVVTSLSLIDFIHNNPNKIINQGIKKYLLPKHCQWALEIKNTPHDPFGIKTQKNMKKLAFYANVAFLSWILGFFNAKS